jgi:tetratricopeptide (TPR) repeat protein
LPAQIALPAAAGGNSADVASAESYAQFPELMRLNRWKEVATRAQDLHQKYQHDPRALYWLGMSRLQLHDPIQATQALRSAEILGLNTALFHEGLGLAYYDLNQFSLFGEQMAKSAQLDPGDSKPYYYLGLYQWTIRPDPKRALEQFEKAIDLQPEDWRSVYQAGNCLDQLGRLDQARERYLRAITLVEQQRVPFGWPYQGMGRLLLDENPRAAADFARRAISLEPAESSNHLLLEKAYERLGDVSQAIREARTAAAQNPTDSSAVYTLYKLYRRAVAILCFAAVPVLTGQFGSLASPNQIPQAKSQNELDRYLAIVTSTEPREVIGLVSAFAQDFARSELISSAYQAQLHAYERLDDFDGMLVSGRRSLAGSPDNLNTLLSLASAIANRAGQRADRGQLLGEAEGYAEKALTSIARIRISHKLSLEQWKVQKRQMQSEAHGLLGIVALQRNRLAEALSEFKTALALAPQPEGVQFLRLGLAQASAGDKQAAEESLHRAAERGPDPVRSLAVSELNRLRGLAPSPK